MKTLGFSGHEYHAADIPPERLFENASQPPERSALDNGRRQALLEDMSRNGQLTAISVVRDRPDGYTILAGHGRTQCAIALGWPTIRANVFQDGPPEAMAALRAQIHKSEKDTVKTLSGNDQLTEQYLEWQQGNRGVEFERSAVTTRNLQFLESQFGKGEGTKAILARGVTHIHIKAARVITRDVHALGKQGPVPPSLLPYMKQALLWLIDHKMVHLARAWLEAGRSPRKLDQDYIQRNRPLPRSAERRNLATVTTNGLHGRPEHAPKAIGKPCAVCGNALRYASGYGDCIQCVKRRAAEHKARMQGAAK